MGFGYLLIGYLVTFVIYLTLQALGLGGLGLLVGYGIMLLGLCQLHRFQNAFAYAKWSLIPLLVLALYESVVSLTELFLLELPFPTQTVDAVAEWATFLLIIFFNMTLLYGIRALAIEVELPRINTMAVRNSLVVGAYGVLYVVGQIPGTEQYLVVPLVILQIVWVALNLFLFLTCAKDICPEGEEEILPKRYRWELLNKIGDAYERNRQRSIEQTTREAEEALRRRQEKRNQKKITHHKKKKR
jgi:hypothetical protein